MDFSEYGRSTPDWENYLAKNPSLLIDGGLPTASIKQVRHAANAGRTRWSERQVAAQGLESRFSTHDHEIAVRDGSRLFLRQYTTNQNSRTTDPLPACVHFHGGGYLNGSLDTETSVCAAIAVRLNMVVLHPEYRHTDTVKYPTMFHDVQDLMDWIFANATSLGIDPMRIVVGGQSAGSGLAASIVQREIDLARQEGRSCRIRGQILTIPWLMHPDAFPVDAFASPEVTSTVQCGNKLGLSTEKLYWFTSLLDVKNAKEPLFNPGLRSGKEVEGMPKSAFIVAGGDPLRDQGLFYAKNLAISGIGTKVHVFPAVPHTFRSCDGLPSATLFVERMLECISWALPTDGLKDCGNAWVVES